MSFLRQNLVRVEDGSNVFNSVYTSWTQQWAMQMWVSCWSMFLVLKDSRGNRHVEHCLLHQADAQVEIYLEEGPQCSGLSRRERLHLQNPSICQSEPRPWSLAHILKNPRLVMPSSVPLVALFLFLGLVVLNSSGASCFSCPAHVHP